MFSLMVFYIFLQQTILFIKILTNIIKMAQELEPHILRKFEILQKLGKGAYGVVWKAVDKQTKQVVALKKVFDAFQNATDAQRTYRQVIFLQQLNGHPNIVSLLNVIKAESPKDIYLVFDFMETDLHAVVRANIMEDVHKKYVLYQVLKGIKYMHSGQLIHRDLKPSNILLDSDCLAKLADFGLARSVASINQSVSQPIMTQYVATRWYRAPQILLGSSKYTKAVDMWSVGCILGQLYVGKAIFPGNSTLNQVQRIIQLLGKPTKQQIQSMESVMAKQCLNQINFVKKRSFSSFFQTMDSQALDLIKRLLVFNPKQRLTVEEALSHPYLEDFHQEQTQTVYNGVIQIAIDENTKYSIKQYREALHRQINKRRQPQKKSTAETHSQMHVLTENDLRRKQKQRERQVEMKEEKRRLQEKRNQQKRLQEYRNNRRDSCKKKESSSVSKQNYYYHTHHSNQVSKQSQSKQKSSWMRSQKGKSFYDKYQKYQNKPQKCLERTYTAQNGRRR